MVRAPPEEMLSQIPSAVYLFRGGSAPKWRDTSPRPDLRAQVDWRQVGDAMDEQPFDRGALHAALVAIDQAKIREARRRPGNAGLRQPERLG